MELLLFGFLVVGFVVIALVKNNSSSANVKNNSSSANATHTAKKREFVGGHEFGDYYIEENFNASEKIRAAFQKHKNVLRRKMKLLVEVDDYGYVDRSAWEQEKKYFLQKTCPRNEFPVLWSNYDEDIKSAHEMANINVTDEWARAFFPDDPSKAYAYIQQQNEEYEDIVDRGLPSDIYSYHGMIDEWLESDAENTSDDYQETFSALDYEHYCAEQLEKSGWTTKVTSSSGDQGIDIVASQLNTTIVIQCKKYTSPVGNKAVQEVVAGMGYIEADGACVVTNSTFTKSAKELAKANGVKLLHHEGLASLMPTDFWDINKKKGSSAPVIL